MRIYNGTKSQVNLPLGTQRLTIPSHTVSGDFMPNNDFLSLLVSSYGYDELALIVSGPFEITLCSSIPSCAGFVVQSLEEAIERFTPKTEEKKEIKEEVKPEEKPIEPEVNNSTTTSDIVKSIKKVKKVKDEEKPVENSEITESETKA